MTVDHWESAHRSWSHGSTASTKDVSALFPPPMAHHSAPQCTTCLPPNIVLSFPRPSALKCPRNPVLQHGSHISLKVPRLSLTIPCHPFFPSFAWHGFGRNSCALHHSLLLLSRLRPKNFFSTLSLRSLRPSVKFSGSPQECIRFGIWEHAPLAIPCPSKRA